MTHNGIRPARRTSLALRWLSRVFKNLGRGVF
jgi:hypothetical protein